MADRRVGFIGLGLMGSRMAMRLQDGGYDLTVYNRTREKAEPLAKRGAQIADSPAAVGAEARLIGLMLLDGGAVDAVLEGPHGLAAALTSKHAVVNFSTVGLEGARRAAAAVEAAGATYLDAPVLGSIEPARSGDLVLFVGGDAEVLERCRPVLRALGRRTHHLGPIGAGSGTKLAANMLLARYVEALGEVFRLLEALKLEPRHFVQILQDSALSSPMWNKAPKLLEGEAPLHFPLSHMAKDLRLLDDECRARGVELPAHRAVHELFQAAVAAGLGDKDYSEIVRQLEA